MKSVLKYGFILLLCGAVAWLSMDRIRMLNKIERAEKEIVTFKIEQAGAIQQIEQLTRANAILAEKEIAHVKTISEMEREIALREKAIQELRENRPETPPGCEEVVAHYQAEIQAWKNQFSLAQREIQEYKELTLNLRLQLENEKEINAKLKEQLDRANSILDAQISLMAELRRGIIRQSESDTFVYVWMAVLGAGVIYTMISR